MNGNDLLNKMELADPAFVAEADTYPKRIRRRPAKWMAVAACIVLIAGTTTVLAATGLGTKILQLFTKGSGEESGYVLSADIVKYPADDLKGQIQEVSDQIKEQFASYQPYMDRLPGHVEKTFDTRGEACDYVGFDGLERISWDLKEEESTLNVYGDEDGKIQSVTIETPYTAGDMRLQFFTMLYTENYEDEIATGSFTTEDVKFAESSETTAHGLGLHVIESTALESGYMGTEGYLVKDGVLYNLYIAHLEKDKEQAKELLQQWADLF